MIYFAEVNEENWQLDLAVSDNQKRYVSLPYLIYARA